VSYIFVHGAGGEDNISVTSVDGTGSIGASITGDDGNDSIKLNFDGGVWGGDGNDVIYLTDSFQGVAHGGAGNDQMYIVGACYNAMIIGDTGNDFIDCSQNYYSVVVHAGLGNDTVYGSAYDDQLYGDGGNDEMYGLEGNDSFYTSDNTNGLVDGGNGYDILYTGASVPSAANIEQQYML
jgi:Ca2+-binding RTX toxin-like protein